MQQEGVSTGTPKPTKVWEDRTLGMNALTLQLTAATGKSAWGRGGREQLFAGIPLWRIGYPFLLVTVPGQTQTHFILSPTH